MLKRINSGGSWAPNMSEGPTCQSWLQKLLELGEEWSCCSWLHETRPIHRRDSCSCKEIARRAIRL